MSSDNNEKILDAVASPEDLREVAQQELGETAAVKEQALIQLRELILGDSSDLSFFDTSTTTR